MNSPDIQNIILTAVQILVLLYAIVKTARKRLTSVYFILAMGSLLLSDIYYLIYDMLRPGTRMPFAANEIAECAMLLFLSACLETVFKEKCKDLPKAMPWVVSLLFIGGHIIQWILWSGEWVQDTVFGLPYVYLLYLLIRGFKYQQTYNAKEKVFLYLINIAILAVPTVAYLFTGSMRDNLEKACYIPMFILLAYLFVKYLKVTEEKRFCLSFAFFFATLLVMYLSRDLFYNIAMIINSVAIILMQRAVCKYETAEKGGMA